MGNFAALLWSRFSLSGRVLPLQHPTQSMISIQAPLLSSPTTTAVVEHARRRSSSSSRRAQSLARHIVPDAAAMAPPCQSTITDHTASERPMAIPWGRAAHGPSFNAAVEFRPSAIQGAGMGTYAKTFIPAQTRLRRVAVADGTLHRFGSLLELQASGWDLDDAVNYGIGHKRDPAAIYFLNPGTAMNHADPTRVPSVEYRFPKPGVIETWSTRDIEKGEEMFNDYGHDFGACGWYDEFQTARGI